MKHGGSWLVRASLAALFIVVAGCDSPPDNRCSARGSLPDSWTMRGFGVELEVRRAPYGITVRDGDGKTVLESVDDGAADGFGAAAWTTGSLDWSTFVSPGYFQMFSGLDPWHDAFEVVAADVADDHITVTLADHLDGRSACVEVTHRVTDSSVRVDARVVDGDAPRAWAAGFATPSDEGFLGFGERFNQTDQRGVDVYSFAEEGGIGDGEGTEPDAFNPFPNGQAMTYYPVPFFLSTEGYGFWLDSTYRNEFNLATTRPDAWRVWHIGPTLSYQVFTPIPDDPRPWPYHVIDGFSEATGRPMLPPAWSFGPRRRIGRGSMADGMGEIEAMRDQDLAITAVDDSNHFYPSGSHIGREPELKAWIERAEALGYRVNGYYNSFIDQNPEGPLAYRAAEGDENGYYIKMADGSYPDVWIITGGNIPQLYIVDFTNPEATAWYQDSYKWATELGYVGWMYDFAEYVPPGAIGYDGTSGEALHNLYPVLYAKALHDAMEASPLEGEWFAFQRSGYTGQSHWVPMVWSGDPAASFEESDGLPSMIPAGVNVGVSGAPHWGGDIGGFHCTADGYEAADEELLTRWIQQGSMGSNMMDQNACVGSSSSLKASIWKAPAAKEAWREYARLHTRLFPYLYTLAHDATRTGAPTMRHVFLEHPDQKQLRGEKEAYYLGSALYVAPVVHRGDREKTVELPPGTFLDWREQELVTGGQTITLDAPLDKLPLLLRENHLVPMLDPTIDTLADEDNPEVVGRADVAGVYDVVGLLTAGGSAGFKVWDAANLEATRTGAPSAPAGFTEATDEAELADCTDCYRIDDLGGGLSRVRVSTNQADVMFGGLRLQKSGPRRIRWDLYLAP